MGDIMRLIFKRLFIFLSLLLSVSAYGAIALEKIVQSDDGLYHIKTVGQLYWYAKNKPGNAVLDNDIVVNRNVLDSKGNLNSGNFEAWTPIGSQVVPYGFSFNGRGFSIKGLYIRQTSNVAGAKYLGLFGAIDNATIDSVVVEDSYIHGYSVVSGVCGYAKGNSTIMNCVNKSTVCGEGLSIGGVCGYAEKNDNGQGDNVKISNCHNYGLVKGTRNSNNCKNIGGICGYSNNGHLLVEHCTNYGSIIGEPSCQYLGGVCGYLFDGTLSGCANFGTITGGNSNLGSITGAVTNETATILGCYTSLENYPICGHNFNAKNNNLIEDNVLLYKDEDGGFRCQKFTLTDGNSFYSPVDFVADTLIYTRSMSTGYSTFVLPFNVPVDYINADVYKLSDFDGSNFRFKRVVGDSIETNVPYLARVNEGDEGVLVTECYNVRCVAHEPTPVVIGNSAHFGLYETQKCTTDVHRTYYGFSAGKLMKVNKTFTVNPFRTGFYIDTPAANKLMSIGLLFDDRLGVECVPYLPSNAEPTNSKVYDVYGRLVYSGAEPESCIQSLANGVYVVNGKKVMVINGSYTF